MKHFINYHQDRKYKVYLHDITGEPVAYAVWIDPVGKNSGYRMLWHKGTSKPMPQKLKDVINARGSLELIAQAMGW